MIKNIAAIETAFGFKPGEFDAMYKATEEREIDLSNIEIMKKADKEAMIKNIKEQTSIASVEMAVKEARTKYGLDFTGKTFENFADAYSKKVLSDAKIEPEKKVKELETDLEKMRINVSEWETKYKTTESEYKKKENQRVLRETIFKKIPDNTKIPKEDVLNLFLNKNEVDISDAGILFKKNGETLKNTTTLNPLTIDEIMPDFLTPYINPPAGGGGGGDNPGQNKPGGLDAFTKEMADKNISVGTKQYVDEMRLRHGNGTLKFD